MKKNEVSYKNLFQVRPKTETRPRLGVSNSSTKLVNPLQQYQSSKQNDCRLTNRPQVQPSYQSHQPRLKKQFKLYTQMEQDEKDKLRLKIQRLEEVLQKKMCDSGFLSYFKTGNSSAGMSHVDIYLQLTKFQESNTQKGKAIKELQYRLNQSNDQLQRMLVVREQYQRTRVQHLKQIKMFDQVVDKLKASSQQARQYKERYNEVKGLCEQVQKQRISHLKRIKELEEGSLEHTVRELNDEIEKFALRCDEFSEQNRELTNQNSRLRDFSNQNLLLKQSLEQAHQQAVRDTLDTEQQNKLNETKFKQQIEDIAQMQRDLSRLQEKCRRLEEKDSKLQEKCDRLSKQVCQKESLLLGASKTAEQLKKSRDALEIEKNYEKCMRDKQESEVTMSKNNASRMSVEVMALEATNKAQLSQIYGLERQTLSLNNQLRSLKGQMSLLLENQEKAGKEMATITSQSLQHSLNQKKLSTDKYRLMSRLQDLLSKAQPSTHTSLSHDDDLEKVVLLIQSAIKTRDARLQQLISTVERLHRQNSSSIQEHLFKIKIHEETIKLLLKFVPTQTNKLVEMYLMMTEEVGLDNNAQQAPSRTLLMDDIAKEAQQLKAANKLLYQSHLKMQERELSGQKRDKELMELRRQRHIEETNREKEEELKRRHSTRLSMESTTQKETRFREKSSNKELIKKYMIDN